MSLGNTFDSGVKSKVAAGFAAAWLSVAGLANATDNKVHNANFKSEDKCAPLYINKYGFEENAGVSANKYSREKTGVVGINIHPAPDLGNNAPEKLGRVIRDKLREQGVEAECFVSKTWLADTTKVQFQIVGQTFKEAAYGIGSSYAPSVIKSVSDEAKTAGLALSMR